jgi:hypothetical protein
MHQTEKFDLSIERTNELQSFLVLSAVCNTQAANVKHKHTKNPKCNIQKTECITATDLIHNTSFSFYAVDSLECNVE